MLRLLVRILACLFSALLIFGGLQLMRLGISEFPPPTDNLAGRYAFFLSNTLLALLLLLAAVVVLRKARQPDRNISNTQRVLVVLSAILAIGLGLTYLDGFEPRLRAVTLFVLLTSTSAGGVALVFLSVRRSGSDKSGVPGG
jgi:hypothetical protein